MTSGWEAGIKVQAVIGFLLIFSVKLYSDDALLNKDC